MAEKIPAKQLGANEAIEYERLRNVARAGLRRMVEASVQTKLALVSIKDQHLYRADYSSFAEFCWQEFQISHRTVNRWIEQGRSLLELEEGDETQTGRSARDARPTLPSQRGLARARKEGAKVVDTTATRIEPKSGQGMFEPELETPNKGEGDDGSQSLGSSGQPAAGAGAVAPTTEGAESDPEPEPANVQDTAPAPGDTPQGPPEHADPLKAFVESWRVALAALASVPAQDHTPRVWTALLKDMTVKAGAVVNRKIAENLEVTRV